MTLPISVVIPAYNRASRIVRAIDSALSQSLPPLEVIVVDDASTDGTADKVRERYSGDGRVKVLVCRHRIGACGARNMGMALATSGWIAFLDSDDAWDGRKLEHQAAAIVAEPGSIAAFATVEGHVRGKVAYVNVPPDALRQEDLFFENRLGTTSCLLVRRLSLMEVGAFDRTLPSCQDWDLYLRLFDAGKLVPAPAARVFFDDGDHPRISNAYGKVHAGHRTVFSRIRARIDDPGLLDEVNASHALYYAELAFRRRGSHTRSLGYALLALVRHPTRSMGQRVGKLAFALAWDVKWRLSGRPALN